MRFSAAMLRVSPLLLAIAIASACAPKQPAAKTQAAAPPTSAASVDEPADAEVQADVAQPDPDSSEAKLVAARKSGKEARELAEGVAENLDKLAADVEPSDAATANELRDGADMVQSVGEALDASAQSKTALDIYKRLFRLAIKHGRVADLDEEAIVAHLQQVAARLDKLDRAARRKPGRTDALEADALADILDSITK